MTPAQFRATLARLGLRQVDFARLLSHLSGEPPNQVTVNRWATGRRAVPPTVVALLTLWRMIPQAKQRQILDAANPKSRS